LALIKNADTIDKYFLNLWQKSYYYDCVTETVHISVHVDVSIREILSYVSK